MDCYSETSLFDFSINSSEYAQDANNVEYTAAKALKNINLLYNEIMSPKEYRSEELEFVNYDLNNSSSFISHPQNHFVKSCCNALKELCIKCDRYIARCSSCNRCQCNVTNDSFKTVESYKDLESKNYVLKCTSAQSNRNYKVKCTVPRPFSLYEKNEEQQRAKELKICKMKQELENKIDNELLIRANCKPVPKSTHLPLYNQMIKEREKQKKERKEKCFEILNEAKPFNLHSSKRPGKAKSSSDLASKNMPHFKAKPVPKHILSSKVSEKLKNKEEVRKMLIMERAQQTKEQSSLPFSTKPVTYSRSLIDLCNFNKPKNKELSKPKNISEITKRLYIKKCNETMNNWNRKVLQVDADKKIDNMEMQSLLSEHISFQKKQLTKTEELPFMYFPVRMSNAAILREKQIRAEILARKEREEKSKECEHAIKKTNADILHKLRSLIPSSEGEKEIDEKVKSYRESQVRRKHEYEKELEEIMKRVSEQTLLLERQSKVMKESLPVASESDDKSSQYGEKATESDQNASESEDNKSQKSVASNSSSSDSSHKSSY